MRWLLPVILPASLAAQTIEVGQGAPTQGVALTFITAWGRNGFNNLVGDPTTKVAKFGSVGLIQTFPSKGSSSVTLALVKPDSTEADNVQQVLAPMYAYYASVGVATAGYPMQDTVNCPAVHISKNSCQWQPF